MTIDEIIATEELGRRPLRKPNYRAENWLLRRVAADSGRAPQKLLDRLVGSAVTLCDAGSAGLSLLDKDSRGGDIFKWVAMAGVYKSLVGGTTPRDFSPCGTCLDRGSAQLYRLPARYFKYLGAVQPPIYEGLVIPIAVGKEPLGTIWIVTHEAKRVFDAEDARMMTSIAAFLATVLRQRQFQSATEGALAKAKQSDAFSKKVLNTSPDCIKVLNHKAELVFMNEPGKAALKVKASDVIGKKWFTFWASKDRLLAREAFRMAQRGGEGRFQGYRPTFTGEARWWDVIVTSLSKDEAGNPTYLAISRDVTEGVISARKLVEANEKLVLHASTLEERVEARTKDLRFANQRMQMLGRKLVQSQEDERRCIARELHDEIGQQLTGLKLSLEKTHADRSGGTSRGIQKAVRMVSKLQKQTQTLSFALRQSLPDHVALERALQWHFRRLEQTSNLVVHFECDKLREETIGPEIRHTIFRIVQEALTNVVRHSQVREARVALRQSEEKLSLDIVDSGIGFGTRHKKNGMSAGLVGMAERVLLLGGEFDVLSRKGVGTRVRATVPTANGIQPRRK